MMDQNVPNRFNLVDEKWIPVANEGLVSLHDVFSKPHLTALGGNPVQKIALTKLLLAIVQSAYTPKDDEEWKQLGADGMAAKALEYLKKKKGCFWLYGENPFLQMPAIVSASIQPYGAVMIGVATGNTTVVLQSQVERPLTDAEKALLVVELGGFALGGKKTDNSVVLTPGYTRKHNEKGKPSTGKPGPALGFMGFLHSFLAGSTILETLWLNMLTISDVRGVPSLKKGLGMAPWEAMPMGEDCIRAQDLKETYLGRMVPLCRYMLLGDDGLHYSEGISYPGYAEGGFDLSTGVDYATAKPRALWADTEKRPWRQLTSILAFLANEKKNAFDCYQLRIGLLRARTSTRNIGIWSGGLRVSSNAGEQYASGTDDFVESEFHLETDALGEDWFLRLRAEMTIIEELAKNVYGSTLGYFNHPEQRTQQLVKGKDQAKHSANLFWQLAEHHFQTLINACGTNTSESLRPVFANLASKSFDSYCPRNTARQLDAWAACRPPLGKYIRSDTTPKTSTLTPTGA
jgi:CRISPR system Cascade subunit CasA